MAKDYAAPKAGFIKDPESTLKVATPKFGFVTYAAAAAGAGAVMNQIQKSNLGADLYNGTIQ